MEMDQKTRSYNDKKDFDIKISYEMITFSTSFPQKPT